MKALTRIGLLCAVASTLCVPKPASADVYAEYEVAGTRSAYHTDTSISSRRTDHFIMRFGPKCKEGILTEQLFQGQLQFMENVYDTWQILGLHPLGGYDPNIKYKGVIQPHSTWDGDLPGTAVSFEEGPGVPGIHVPCNAALFRSPNGCTPHEFGHGWQNQHPDMASGGLPTCEPQGFTESLANWMMQQQLAGYPQDWITVALPYGHAAVGYNCMSIFNYFMYAPGYGVDFINKLVLGPNLSVAGTYDADDIIRKAIRMDTSGAVDKAAAIHDGLGMMNAKMLDMDFWNHRVNRAYYYDQDTTWSGYQFNRIPMVRQPGVAGVWYRPEWSCTPQVLSNNYIPLTITDSASPRTVTCDFRPVADAVRGTSFRACFVAFNKNKEARYSKVWNAGENSFTLADDENTVYLAIIACPKALNGTVRYCDYTKDNVAMFPYRIKLTGADPKGWQWTPPTSGYHTHSNGGGMVANTATVDASAYVGLNAMVLGSAKVYGNSRIEDYAVVDKQSVIGRSGQSDNPVISGHAYVTGTAQVYGHAKVRDYGWVWGAAKVYDNAIVMSHTMINGATVFGNAVMNQAPLRDTGLSYSGSFSGCAIIGGDTSGGGTYDKGIYCEFPGMSVADNAYQYLGYNFEKKSCIFAMDQYGMNHSYLMNEPQVVSDSVNNKTTNVLNLNGVDQYVELRPDAVDFADLTISTWVKWTGTTSNQKIFSTGDGSGKYMYLTPKDGATGNLRFVISNGTTTQYLDGTAPLSAGVWTHVAVTFSGSTGTLYVNGTGVDTGTVTIDPDQLHAPLMADSNFIGRDAAGSYFSGRIDEFRVYNKALSATEVASVRTSVKSGAAPAADTAAPTPTTAVWLVAPTASVNNSITMSAVEGADAGGNGVLYYFKCVNDSTHDSGWISENTYKDCKCQPGVTHTYTVRMKDKRGNTGAESAQASATTDPEDTEAPAPNPPTFAYGPAGASTTSITMTATEGTDADETIMYKFNRMVPGVGTLASSGWTSSRTWTDTGLTSGASYNYTLQMKDGHGNTTSTSAVKSAVAKDDTPPTLDADFRMQWDTYPYTQLDRTVRMYARTPVESGVDYYYECVENPTINSGWSSNKEWVTPVLPFGTYSFRFKIRDRALNESSWSATKSARVLTSNTYNDCSLGQLADTPDDTLVRFSGKVTQVAPTYYVVSAVDGSASIKVVPRSYGNKTDTTLLNQMVNVKGHLWTYNGSSRVVDYAIVWGSPQSGKIEFENCDFSDGLIFPLYDETASGSEYLGWHQGAWAVSVPNVAAATQMTIASMNGGGKISLYVNGSHYKDLTMSSTGITTVTGLTIPAGANLMFRKDSGDSDLKLDYMILGPVYSISGKVTNTSGAGISGATVYFSTEPKAAVNPSYVATTDASGNYTELVPEGTWYVSADAASQCYVASPDQTVTVKGASVSNINFTLQSISRNFPREDDLLFACVTDMLPESGNILEWGSYRPVGLTLTPIGSPTVETINSQKWVKNVYGEEDGFKVAQYSSAIPVNGATIVVAVKPKRSSDSGNWRSIVDVFYDRLVLGIANNTGNICVRRNGDPQWSSTAIPDGQTTILSLVVQADGKFKVYSNGTQIMSVTGTSDMTSLVPNVPGPYANAINVGRNNPDGWTVFNGNIGDVALYKVALSDAERQQLEASFATKFGAALKSFNITASAGAGGSISPAGTVPVFIGTDKTFTITPSAGYVIGDVTVNGVSKGAIGSYTFTNVTANQTISATFVQQAVTVPSIAALKAQSDGTMVKLTGQETVIYAPVDTSDNRTTNYFYIGEKQAMGGLKVIDKVSDGLILGNQVTSLTGYVRKPAGGEVYLELTSDVTGSGYAPIRPVGMNTKSILTDPKAPTNTVKAWGTVKSVIGTVVFTLNDGYGSDVVVKVNGVGLPSGFGIGKTAVVTGVLGGDKALYAQDVRVL